MKIGDKVRFLNAVGEGVIVGFQSKEVALVRDADDFDVPTHVRDLVVVCTTNQYNFPTELPVEVASQPNAPVEEPEPEVVLPPYTFSERDETPEGEQLSVYLAFVPTDIKQLQACAMDVYLVNCSNYYLKFSLLKGKSEVKLQLCDGIEPQTKLLLDTVEKVSLNDWEEVRFQAFAYKNRTFLPKPVIDVTLNINPVRFYKLHTFVENDFFEQPALLLTIIENDVFDFGSQIDVNALQQAIQQKDVRPERKPVRKPFEPRNPILEVDLHINALLDDSRGMSNGEMLQYQLDKFNEVMRENRHKRGRKIVFIHGRGEGVLRAAIEKELKTKYRSCYFQDASFQQYGFGATQVTIR